jgi:hypothetical protein
MNSSRAPIVSRLESLPKAREVRPGDWIASCPAHSDAHPSLGWTFGRGGRVLLRCHAGCAVAAIVQALGATMSDLFVSAQPRDRVRAGRKPAVSRHRILDLEGTLQAIHVCTEGPDGKRFTWQGPDGQVGLAGRPASTLPFYRTETLNGAALDDLVIVTEGEKAAIALATIWPDLVVATVTGAASIPEGEVLEVLRGRPVVLWPDCDRPGGEHMARLAEALLPIASAVRVLDVPNMPLHGDAADYVDAGRGSTELLDLIKGAPSVSAQTRTDGWAETILRFRTGREIGESTPAVVPWRAKPYLVDGAVLEVVGKIKAAGKTTFVTFMCRAIVTGIDFLGEPTVQGGVIYLTEQGDASLRETLGRADLLGRDDFIVLQWTDTGEVSWPDVVELAADEAERRGAKVLVVDTLTRFAGIHGEGENHAGEADSASGPLLRAAARGLAVITVRHERKAGGDVGESGRGSSAFGGAVDTIMAIRRGEGRTSSSVRVVTAISRFDGVPESLVVELTAEGYVSHGSDTDVAVADGMAVIYGRIAASSAGLTIEELSKLVPRSTAQRAIDRLIADKRVNRLGKGVRNDAFRLVVADPSTTVESLPAPPVPLNYGLFGDDEEWGMGTA